jgi:dTDP-4-amino-4,6-dideoxygalactose transaminase
MHIPFIDLPKQHQQLEEELLEVFREALSTASFIGGHQVEEFEKEFAAFCGTKYCVGVNSGTDALRFALIAAGIGPGDEVITVPNTFIATAEAISQAGATPAFVDIDEQTYNLDPNKLEDYLRKRLAPDALRPAPRPKAVLPVHLYGQPADMDTILKIAERYNLVVIEDACQAHGAKYFSKKQDKWVNTGSLSLAAAFSFYPGKNLGACGEGGAATTNDEALAAKIKMLRDHGQIKKYYHDLEGYNGRLDAMQAGCLRIKLKRLSDWNESRRENASKYSELFDNLDGVVSPHEPSWSKAVYHLYVIRHPKRHELQKYLAEKGVATGIHYPIPIHLQNAYKHLGYKKGDFPVAEKLASEILSLPMYPELTAEQQQYIVETIKKFISR